MPLLFFPYAGDEKGILMSTIICKTCKHNCNPKTKDKPPIIANKPNAICWCNAESGRAITKKYKQCKFYESKENNK